MRVAVYAGTFDPIPSGHLSVIERARRLCDRLVVVIAVNPEKKPLFSLDERAEMIRAVIGPWPDVTCAVARSYVIELARDLGARTLVRGVRGATDVQAEIALADANRALAPEIETVFIPAHPALSAVSSSHLKELARQGLDVSRYCPPEISARLVERARGSVGAEREAPHV